MADNRGRGSMNMRFVDEGFWLTPAQLVEIYQSSKANVSEHQVLPVGHDRFLIIDDAVYVFGASLKDAGKRLLAYSTFVHGE